MNRNVLFFSFGLLLGPLAAVAQAPADTTLQISGVEIQGSRFSGLSEQGDKKMLQVDRNLSSLTSTTSEAFRQLPSVMTDIEGTVSFRGSNQVGMLLNGVPYGLLEENRGDVLIQLPALFYNRIAVSSFSPIEWVPDGDAGVISLDSRRYTRDDSPFMVTLGGGWHERYNAGAVLNLHPGRFHIIAKYDYRKEYRARTFNKYTTTPKNRTEMNNNAAARPDTHIADLSVAYDVTDRDQLAVGGLFYSMDYDRLGRINNQVFNPKGELAKHVIRNRYNTQDQQAYAADASWTHRFSDRQQLQVRFNYNNFSYDEDNDFKNENPQNGKIVAEDNQYIDQTKHSYYWTAGYRQRGEDWGMAWVYTGRMRTEDYATTVSVLTDGQFVLSDAKSYTYEYDRSLQTLAGSFDRRWGAWSAEVALQAEFSHDQMRFAKEESHSRFHLYPSARFGYALDRWNRLQVGYQERVIRPLGSYLCPFVNSSDATHITQGNPDLKDEQIHQVELGYQFEKPAFRLSSALFYRNRQNRIMETASQQESQTVWQWANIGHSQSVGFELSTHWQPVRFLSLGLSGEVYRDEMDGRTIGYDEKKSLVCGDVKANVHVQITPTTELQVDGFYQSDQLTPQGKILDRYCVNAGLSQYVWQRKLRLNLSVNNLFDSLGETTLIDTEALQMRQERNRDARVAWLTVTYLL
ncbi:MAG: TonB-dependent receptor domain-containing protein [Parabacteroides sp.]